MRFTRNMPASDHLPDDAQEGSQSWNRRALILGLLSIGPLAAGCRGYSYGQLLKPTDKDLVGSHEAGSEVFHPLVDESVAKLLSRQQEQCIVGPDGFPQKKTICFVCVENKMSEDIGDFKDQLYEQIDSKILESDVFRPISRRMVDAALHETRLRPDSLMVPDNMQLFTSVLQRQGAPIDYLLYAKLTSGTTERNTSKQRDYLLTLELTNVHSGEYSKESAEIRKGYHKTPLGGVWNYNPLK
ncbi:MAG: penicillin-binding protein activator LpoB [Planctomycetota bacterium]